MKLTVGNNVIEWRQFVLRYTKDPITGLWTKGKRRERKAPKKPEQVQSNTKVRHYNGKPCKSCYSTLRYINGNGCVRCLCKNVRERHQRKLQAINNKEADKILE